MQDVIRATPATVLPSARNAKAAKSPGGPAIRVTALPRLYVLDLD